MKNCNSCSNIISKIALAIVLVGSVFWLGMPLDVNLVSQWFGNFIAQNVVYGILGLAGVYLVVHSCMCVESCRGGLCKVSATDDKQTNKSKDLK